jgi:hypothetical protein
MGLGFFYFIGWTLLLSFLGLAIYLIYSSTRDKEDPENQSILFNYTPQYAHGFCLGLIDSIETASGVTKITFFPRDLNYIRLAKKDKNLIIKPQVLFASNKCVDYLPTGSLSSFRNIVIVYPQRIEEIPEKVKESKSGLAIMRMVGKTEEDINAESFYRKIINSQAKIQDLGLPDKMAQDFMEKVKEMHNPIDNLADKAGDK